MLKYRATSPHPLHKLPPAPAAASMSLSLPGAFVHLPIPSRRLLILFPAPSSALSRRRFVPRSSESVAGVASELELSSRDVAEVLSSSPQLTPRDLRLLLLRLFRGADAYCALEVFDHLRRSHRVDGETVELMAALCVSWVERMVGGGYDVTDVAALLGEMDCVGLEPGFSMAEKVVALYWERGEKERAVEFVKDVVRRGGVGQSREIGGPIGYLAWKMMMDGNYMDAVRLIVEFKEKGLNPDVYSYLIGLSALVKEQKEFSKALRKLNGSIKEGTVLALDAESLHGIENYQSELIKYALLFSDWAAQNGSLEILRLVHERLLSIFTCAGRGLEAEQHLWELKLLGKGADRQLFDVVLAICASQGEFGAVRRLLIGVEATSAESRKKTLSWLLRGYIKGGFYEDASETLIQMLDQGLRPEYLDRVAVLQGLRKSIQDSGSVEPYIKLCKRLSDMELIGPCLIYLYLDKHKLWTIKMV